MVELSKSTCSWHVTVFIGTRVADKMLVFLLGIVSNDLPCRAPCYGSGCAVGVPWQPLSGWKPSWSKPSAGRDACLVLWFCS